MSADPYWNDDRLAETAAFFGVRFNAAVRRAAPLFGAMHRARLLAAVSMRMAQPMLSDAWEVITPVQDPSRAMRVDKAFHGQSYRRGELSLSVDRCVTGPVAIGRAARAGNDLSRQSGDSLDQAMVALTELAGDRASALTRLMSTVADGIRDFFAALRDMPAIACWTDIPQPETVRQVHFNVSGLRRGGYRLDVAVRLETRRPDTEARLSFAFQIDRNGHRVISLIVVPEMRLLPAEPIVPRNGSAQAVTTG